MSNRNSFRVVFDWFRPIFYLKYIFINILALEMGSPGNRHCTNCIGTLTFPIKVRSHGIRCSAALRGMWRRFRRRMRHAAVFRRLKNTASCSTIELSRRNVSASASVWIINASADISAFKTYEITDILKHDIRDTQSYLHRLYGVRNIVDGMLPNSMSSDLALLAPL